MSGTSCNSTRRGAEEPTPGPGCIPAPDPGLLAALLDEYAPLGPVPLVPEVKAFQGKALLELWRAAERLAGTTLGPPFWGYPWPGGIALARSILDRPEQVAGARVLDLGTGGGVVALAAVRAGAASVVANDRDPWALATARLAAERQGLALDVLLAEVAEATAVATAAAAAEVILCADLAYERRVAPRIRAFLDRARAGGARVLVADAERAYFDGAGFTLLAEYVVPVPRDLEGAESRVARVYSLD